jgi:multidrug resistance efflux pump
MNRYSWRLPLGIAAAITAIAAVAIYPRVVHTGTASARFTGVFEQETVRVISRMGGAVDEVRVREGDRVSPGQVLLRLENEELSARYLQLQQFRKRFGAAKNAASLVASLPPEALGYLIERHPDVLSAENGYIAALDASEQSNTTQSAQALQAAARRRETSRVKAAQSAREALAASANLANDWNDALMAMEAELEGASLKAPVAGTVDILQLRPGDIVLPGQPVAAIARDGRFYMDLSIRREQLGLFQEGLNVGLRIGPDVAWHGTVQHVARTPETGTTHYAVRIDIADPPSGARPGMLTEVELRSKPE